GRGRVLATGETAPVIQIPVAVHDEWCAATREQHGGLDAWRGDPREQLREARGREFTGRVQSQPMPAAADFVDVRELTLGVDLAHTMAGVDEEHVSVRVHDDSGSRVRYCSGGKQAAQRRKNQDCAEPRTAHDVPHSEWRN